MAKISDELKRERNLIRIEVSLYQRNGNYERIEELYQKYKNRPQFSLVFGKLSKKLKQYLRQYGCCVYCKKRISFSSEATIDHIIPSSKGGGNDWYNKVIACRDCNHDKADTVMATNKNVLMLRLKSNLK